MTAVQPSLSVLVAVCQSARFLRRLVASLAAQDVADAEFLFCDDASTDGSVEVLKDVLDEQGLASRARILCHDQRRGVAATRQDLFAAATGRYFIYADADDAVDAGMYAGLLAAAESSGADLAWEGWIEVPPDGTPEIRRTELLAQSSAAALRQAILRGDLHGSLCNKLIRRDFARSAGAAFREGLTCCEDLAFLMDVLAAQPKVTHVEGCHYRYLRRRDSLSSGSSLPHLASLRQVAAHLERLFADAADREAVQAFKTRFRYYAALDFTVPDRVFATYFPEIRQLPSDIHPLGRRIVFWLSAHGLRPVVRWAWRLMHGGGS